MMIIHFIHKRKSTICMTQYLPFYDTKKVVDLSTMINECYDIVLN